MTKNYKISEVARLTNLSIPTLRYYEELGLLQPKRSENNYRLFTKKDLDWIEFIQKAKNTGMQLSKIIEYSKLREQGITTINQRIAILEEQEQLLEFEKRKLQDHIDFLQAKKAHYHLIKEQNL
ncbi:MULTISPECIES: MerR family transcriptional regulator [Enterococcus]|uniref:MerR family transcriptional regulator n=1 Tax=Enterococcus alishanensis TaxID=1303817 RepID=A0ABS6TF44_9ENTE|nr:MerR family transcriptional regulator [Enterococcus alishanensis]MBV7391470.1 MerR family transcriptional regulator [Enterococcus alishanensis]